MKQNQTITVESPATASSARFAMERWKLIAGGVGFVVLTIGIFWVQFHSIRPSDQGPAWNRLRWEYLPLILFCLPIETLASGLRLRLLCRVLHPGIGFWTCVKAELSNVTISLLTPSQTGGGPAQIYMLSRAGVSVGTSLTISLISFMGTMVILLLMGAYSISVSAVGELTPLFSAAFWTVIAIIIAMIAGALSPNGLRVLLAYASRMIWRLGGRRSVLHDWRPPRSDRAGPPVDHMGRLACKVVDLVYTYRDDVRRFLGTGKGAFAWSCLLSAAFLLSRTFMPYLCLRFLGIEASTLKEIVEAQMVILFLVFFAPTPGSAGIAEGASMSILASIVPAGFLPTYNLLWRFSTAYIAALGGLLCLLHAAAEDLRKKSAGPTARDFKLEAVQSKSRTQNYLEVIP